MNKFLTDEDLKVLEEAQGKLSDNARNILSLLLKLNSSPELLDVLTGFVDNKKMGLLGSLLSNKK